jgi:hypothetical protein
MPERGGRPGLIGHQWAKWTGIEVVSCVIELGILGMAVKVLWDLQMKWQSKALVLGILALRLL